MTDVSVGPLSEEEAHIRNAADEAYRVLRGEEPLARSATNRFADEILSITRLAPLRALAIAFVVGVMFARRRSEGSTDASSEKFIRPQ